MTKRLLIHRVALLAALLPMAACGRDAGDGTTAREEAAAPVQGGTAVVASIADMQSMNALTAREGTARMLQREALFMTLFRYNERMEPVPWLAERWDTVRVAPDSLALTLHLRRDVKWHDGQPTTAQDVKFSYERVRDPAVGSPSGSAFALYAPTATVVDPHTVRVRLRPHAEFLSAWAQLATAPAHLLGDVPPAELAKHPFGSERPVGNGPFRFVRRVPGQEWVFEANPSFPAALGGRPYLDRLVYRVIPDQTTLLTETLTGGVDLYLLISPDQIAPVKRSSELRLLSAPAPSWTFIAWNGRLPMFDTPEERRALTMAMDRAGIVRSLLHGHGVPGRATVTPTHWAFASQDPETVLPYNQEAARRLLAAAGWSDRDGDGTVEDASGRPFRFTLKAPQGNQARIDLMQIVQAQLRAIGVDVRPAVVEGNTLIGQISGKKSPRGERERDFEAVVMGWNDDVRKDDTNLFHSRHLNDDFQIASFSNSRVDMLLDTLGLVMDREQARPLWREYQTLMAQQAPKTVLYYPQRLSAARNRLRGVEMDARGEFASVARWWVDPAQRPAR